MKSKVSVRQQLYSILRILNVALITAIVVFILSGSALGQRRLPFIGTRTFCGEIEGTTAIISIRKDGYTTIKTNMVTGLGGDPATAPYESFSGMLNAKGILTRDNFYLTIKSGTQIDVGAYTNDDYLKGKLCTSPEVRPKESSDIQRTPAAQPNVGSNPPPSIQAQSTSTIQIAPDALVTNLYRQAGEGEIVDGGKGASSTDRVFQTRSRALIDKYFDKGFADVMWKALLRYKRMKAYDDPGSFGMFLYGYLGDYVISKGLVGKPSYDGQKAQVIVSFDATDVFEEEQAHKESVVFLLAAGQTGWKITDIKSDDVLCGAGKTSLFDEFNMDSKATDAESKIWNAIQCNDTQGYKHYLQKYPNGAYASVARAKIQEIESGKKMQPDSQPTDRQPLNSGGNEKGSASTPAITNTDSAGANLPNSQAKLTPEDVKRLKKAKDLDLIYDPKVLEQLRLLLGKELPHLEDNLLNGNGGEIGNGWLSINGFQPHNGGEEEGFVGINLDSGAIVAAIFSKNSAWEGWPAISASNPKFKVYGITKPYNGDLKTLPGPLADWIKKLWTRVVEYNNSDRGMKKIDANAPPNIELQLSQPISKVPVRPAASFSSPEYTKVTFEEVKDLEGLVRSFPFLKGDIDDVIAANKDTTSGLGPTTVYLADLHQKGQTRLIFVSQEGLSVCGQQTGCPVNAYIDQGKGFKELDSLDDQLSGRDLYISNDHLSLLECVGYGKTSEWRFENNALKYVDTYTRSQRLSPCNADERSDAPDASTRVTAASTPTAPTRTLGTPTRETVNGTRVDPAAVELSYWEMIKNSTDPEDFKAYLAKYPNGQFAELAQVRVRFAKRARNPAPDDDTAAERARNTHVFEVRDASKTSGWLTVAPGSVTFEPKKPQAGKNMTIQCSEIKHIEQGQSAIASPHVNLFLTVVNGKEGAIVFYTSSGGTGIVGVFVTGLPAKPVVDITTNVINAITEACKLTPITH